MGSFEPFINVLTVLTVLSVAAERVTNFIKLRRHAAWPEDDERTREFRITGCNIGVGIALALCAKADIFMMLARADAPWNTLGWTTWNGQHWVRSTAAADLAGIAQAVLGSVITGVSLGFGSQFWHDTLGLVLELRTKLRTRTPEAALQLAQTTTKTAVVVTPKAS